MTKKEIVDRNISLAFDFVRQIIDHPELLDDIKDKEIIEFVESDKPITEKKVEGNRKSIIKSIGIFKLFNQPITL